MPASHLMKCVYTASVVILYSYLILHGNFAESHRNTSVHAMHITCSEPMCVEYFIWVGVSDVLIFQ